MQAGPHELLPVVECKLPVFYLIPVFDHSVHASVCLLPDVEFLLPVVCLWGFEQKHPSMYVLRSVHE